MRKLLLLLALCSCGKDDKSPSSQAATPKKDLLETKYQEKLTLAKSLQNPANGWIATEDCDAFLWAGKFSAAKGVEGLDLTAAEYPGQPGRFNRRPDPFCEADAGSRTSWSRDMGMGLLTHAWVKKDLPLLERHAAYGEANFWKMGEPLADGRVIYTPSVIGHVYQVIYAIGGQDNVQRNWPSVYSEGLDNYQAHLQMLDIWLRGEIAESQNDADAIPRRAEPGLALSISQTMFARIEEHAGREPNCPFFVYLRGLYGGTVEQAADLLIADTYQCEYGRANEQQILADWLFVATLTLKRLP